MGDSAAMLHSSVEGWGWGGHLSTENGRLLWGSYFWPLRAASEDEMRTRPAAPPLVVLVAFFATGRES
jgi:hypothetical protein